jgi:Fe-S-cluster-containing dehydrogenase component
MSISEATNLKNNTKLQNRYRAACPLDLIVRPAETTNVKVCTLRYRTVLQPATQPNCTTLKQARKTNTATLNQPDDSTANPAKTKQNLTGSHYPANARKPN